MNRTSIEWVKNPDGSQGFTWNPIVGCSRGCSYCYARRIATTRLAHTCPKCATFEPHLHPERLDEPWRRKKPSGIFVCSMGELYDDAYPDKWEKSVHFSMQKASWHRYYILTKATCQTRPFHGTYNGHFWVGTSCDGLDHKKDTCRWRRLWHIRAEKRFISYEPLLKPPGLIPDWLDWIIIGAQTGKDAVKPKREWVTDIIEEADAAGIPIFIKNNLLKIYSDLPRRQEMPE